LLYSQTESGNEIIFFLLFRRLFISQYLAVKHDSEAFLVSPIEFFVPKNMGLDTKIIFLDDQEFTLFSNGFRSAAILKMAG
jgi:hypothetical protein